MGDDEALGSVLPTHAG